MLIYIILVAFVFIIGEIKYFRFPAADISISDRIGIISFNNNLRYFLWFAALSLISGLRAASVGTDTNSYLSIFLAHNGLTDANTNHEFGFILLCRIIGLFTDNPQWLLIVSSCILSFCVLFFIRRNSDNDTLSVFFYITLYYYFFSMNGLRQFLAIGVILISTEFAKKRKLIPFILSLIVALGFHYTALLGIVTWFVFKPKATYKRMICIFAAFLALYSGFPLVKFLVSKFLPRYMTYISSEGYTGRGIMMPIIYSFIFLCAAVVAFVDREWLLQKFNMSFLCMSFIAMLWGFSPYLITAISDMLLQRIGWPFQIYSIILIPNLLSSKIFRDFRLISKTLFIGVGMAHLLYFLSKGWHRVVPYRFFFQ